jgi:predicted Zn finger-like uncharacterized protein
MCEGCETSFNVDDRMIKPTGSKVRCSKCRHVFVAYPAAMAAEADEPLTLQDELTTGAAPDDTAGLKGIDSQLDDLFTEDGLGKGEAALTEQEPELLNVDDLLAEDAPAADPLAAEKLGDDLGLDLDLGLSLEAEAGQEGPAAQAGFQAAADAPGAGAEEPSLDFSLDLEPSAEAAAEESLPSLEELEISLDDLGQVDGALKPAAAEAARSAEIPSGELELDLDLEAFASESADALQGDAAAAKPGVAPEPAASEAKTTAQPPDENELDLSDLEAMLEGEDSPPATTGAATQGIDLDLDLGAVAADDVKSTEMEELDLTAISGAAEESPEPAAAPADELDFSDISGILDEKKPAAGGKVAPQPAQELDLVFDNEAPAAAAQVKPDAPSEPQEDLILDIETLLEEGEEQKPAAAATQELELDFAAGPGRAEASDLEIEIEPVDDAIDTAAAVGRPAATAATATLAAAGVAAAAAAALKPGQTPPPTDEFSTDEFTQAGMTGATDMIEPVVAQKAKPRDKKIKAPRRWGRKLVMATLAVLVLAIAALVLPRSLGIQVPYLSDYLNTVDIPYLKDLEIPYLGKIFQPEPQDTAGNLKIAPVSESLSAEFIDNPGAGRLCVIKGQIRNNYDHPRSFIQVTAKLYAKNKTVAKTATVFAGNVFSNQELAAQDFAGITARFQNKTGANNLNVGVKPGKSIPFMAVFDSLPGNLDEYSVEVAGSSK